MGLNEFIKVGSKIKKNRKKKGLKQKELASMIGIPASTLANYESGRDEPNLEALGKIVAALGITTNELLIDKQNDYSNFKDLADVISIYDGFTTCHGYSAATLFSLIADNKMELANELAGLLAKTQEQGGWLDEDNDLLEDIRSRAG